MTTPDDILRELQIVRAILAKRSARKRNKSKRTVLTPIEQKYITAFKEAGRNSSAAARELGVSQQTLWAALKRAAQVFKNLHLGGMEEYTDTYRPPARKKQALPTDNRGGVTVQIQRTDSRCEKENSAA